MSKYSGESLEARITALEERVGVLEGTNTRKLAYPGVPSSENMIAGWTKDVTEKMSFTTKPAQWSEAHVEDSEPVGTVKPYTNAYGEESDTLVLIKKPRGWETRLKADVQGTHYTSRDELPGSSEESSALEGNHLQGNGNS